MTRTPAQERYEDIYDSKRDLTPFEEAFLATYTAISNRASRMKGAIWNEDGLRGEDYRVACLVVERLKDDDQAKALAALDASVTVEPYPNPTLPGGRGVHAYDHEGNHGFGQTEAEARADHLRAAEAA